MPLADVRAAIASCEQAAEQIRFLCAFDGYIEALRLRRVERKEHEARACSLVALSILMLDEQEFLARTPLIRALRTRIGP
jgi:hypothetical protein